MAGYRNKYDVYDIEKGEFILLDANSGEIEKVSGIPSTKTATYANKGYLHKKRYRVIQKSMPSESVKIAKTKDVIKLMAEWDRVAGKPELWHTIDPTLLGEYGKKFRRGK